MKWLFRSADNYLKQSDWKDLALIKICLFAMGVFVGLQIPKKFKMPALDLQSDPPHPPAQQRTATAGH